MHSHHNKGHGSHHEHEHWGADYDQSPLQKTVVVPLQEAIVTYLAAHASEIERLLDIGCGTGKMLASIAEKLPEAHLFGLDPSLKMAEAAHKATAGFPQIQIDSGEAESLPYEDEAFDTVVTCLSFHHWEDHQKALCEIRRVLKEGGLFLLADTTYTHAPDHTAVHAGHHFFSPEQLQGMFEAADISFESLVDVGGDSSLQLIQGHAI